MTEPDDVQALLADIRAATAAIDAATREQRELREAENKAHAEDDKELAKKRRDGEFGRDWQALQQRIDMNRTTSDDIFSGVDKSDEARAVRKMIERDVMPRLREQFATTMAEDDMVVELENLKRSEKELAETLAEFRKPEPSS